jgi:hypothetical protein
MAALVIQFLSAFVNMFCNQVQKQSTLNKMIDKTTGYS